MRVKDKKREGDKLTLTVLATAEDVDRAFERAELAFARQMGLSPEDGQTVAEAAKAKLKINNLDSVLAPQALDVLVPFALDQRGIIPAFPPHASRALPKRGQQLEFEFEVMLKRDYELGSYGPVSFEMPAYQFNEAQVDERLQTLAKGMPRFVPDAPRPVAMGDTCQLRIEATLNGEHSEGLSSESRRYTTGQGHMPTGFDENIVGLDVGQTKHFSFEGPSLDPDRRGQNDTVECTVTVLAVLRSETPEVTDQWVADNLPIYNTVADLRAAIEKRTDHEQRVSYENYKRTLAAAELAKRFQGTIPDEVYEATSQNQLAMLRSQIQGQGGDFDKFVESQGGEQQFNMMMMIQTRQSLTQGYSLDALYRHEHLEYDDEDVHDVCEGVNPQNPLSVKARMEQAGNAYALREAAQRLCANKWLVDHANITYVESQEQR